MNALESNFFARGPFPPRTNSQEYFDQLTELAKAVEEYPSDPRTSI